MTRGRAMGPGRLWKRGDVWVLDYRAADGRRVRKVVGSDKRVAERLRQEAIARRNMELEGLGAIEGMKVTVAEIARDYVEDLRPRVTPRHYANVSARLEKTVARLDGVRVRDLKPMTVVRLRNQATAAGASNRSANLIVQTLQAVLRWAEENMLIAENPIGRVKPLPYDRAHHRYRRRALTEDEIRRFLAASEDDDEENDLRSALEGLQRVPQTPLWVAAIETAARYGELRQATWGDLDIKRRVVALRAETTKSRKQRSIPLREEFVARLVRLRALHETVIGRLPNVQDRVFLSPEGRPLAVPTTNVMRVFNRLLRAAGIPKVNAQGGKLDLHALRTTAASRMARNGVPLVQTQRILGHSDPKLTAQVYTDLSAEDLRGAVDGLPALGEVSATAKAKEAHA